jgi:hypothetical protein
VRENRLFGGVRNFQQDSTNQTGAGPLEYRAPDPGVPIVWCVFMGDRRCMSLDAAPVHGLVQQSNSTSVIDACQCASMHDHDSCSWVFSHERKLPVVR